MSMIQYILYFWFLLGCLYSGAKVDTILYSHLKKMYFFQMTELYNVYFIVKWTSE